MNLQIWIEVTDEIANDAGMLAVLDVAARNMAAGLGREIEERRIVKSDLDGHQVVCWGVKRAR